MMLRELNLKVYKKPYLLKAMKKLNLSPLRVVKGMKFFRKYDSEPYSIPKDFKKFLGNKYREDWDWVVNYTNRSLHK
jgi:hypothetical protein